MTLFIDPKNYPNALGPSATNQPTVLRCASTRWILPVLIFGDAGFSMQYPPFLMWRWVNSLSEEPTVGARIFLSLPSCWVVSSLNSQELN